MRFKYVNIQQKLNFLFIFILLNIQKIAEKSVIMEDRYDLSTGQL